MIIVLQVAGVVAALVGVLTLYYGIPVKEFSFGNTLILVGAMSLCTGAILFALSVVVLELRTMARRLASTRPVQDSRAKPALPPFPASAGAPVADSSPPLEQPPPTRGQIEPTRAPPVAPPVPEAVPAPPPKPKRNLLFQSSMRRDRDPPEARPAEPPSSSAEAGETPPASFEDAWPKPDRMRGSETSQRRTSRASATPAAASATADTVPSRQQPEGQAAVTVLKSGVVDGMAYSLYSDGSIEAQMPEGMMRFASIDDLRAHLDHRP